MAVSPTRNGTGLAAVKKLWAAHKADAQNWALYDDQFSALLLPTCAGAQGLDEYRKFHRKYLWPSESSGLAAVRRVLQTHYAETSVVEEAVVEITLQEGKEDQLQWILPGVKLAARGLIKTASVLMTTVTTMATAQGVILGKRIYWDQGSLLKQLGLIQPAGNPLTYGFHHDYILPVVGTAHAKLFSGEMDVPFNQFALRLEDQGPMVKTASDDSVMSSLLSGTSTPSPVRPAVRLTDATRTDKQSHVFEDVELPKNAFAGMAINPKKFATHNSIFPSDDGQQQRSRSPSPMPSPATASNSTAPTRFTGASSANRSVYDPLTGDAPIPRVHDPQHHGGNVIFGDEADDAEYAVSRGGGGALPTHLETTVRLGDSASSGTATPTSERGRAGSPSKEVPPHLRSHFHGGAYTPPVNGAGEAPTVGKYRDGNEDMGPAPKPVPRHLADTIHAPEPKKSLRPNPELRTTIGAPEAEADWMPGHGKKANPALKSTDSLEAADQERRASSPKRPPRSDMDTTLDKPAPVSPAKPKPDLKSTVFGGGSDESVNDQSPQRAVRRNHMVSQIAFGSNNEPAARPASPQKHHMKSSVFDADPPAPVSPTRRGYAEHKVTNSAFTFGDDGGNVGMPPPVPKWVAVTPTQTDRRPAGSSNTTRRASPPTALPRVFATAGPIHVLSKGLSPAHAQVMRKAISERAGKLVNHASLAGIVVTGLARDAILEESEWSPTDSRWATKKCVKLEWVAKSVTKCRLMPIEDYEIKIALPAAPAAKGKGKATMKPPAAAAPVPSVPVAKPSPAPAVPAAQPVVETVDMTADGDEEDGDASHHDDSEDDDLAERLADALASSTLTDSAAPAPGSADAVTPVTLAAAQQAVPKSHWQCMAPSSTRPRNRNKHITSVFDILQQRHEMSNRREDTFRAIQYRKAITALKRLDFRVTSADQLKATKLKVNGVGEKLLAKIDQICQTGTCDAVFATKPEWEDTMLLFAKIHGVGPQTARKWYAKGYRTLDDARRDDLGVLSRVQKIGVKYYDDLQLRIPRDEVHDLYMAVLEVARAVVPGIEAVCMGSYRRGAASSGDVDVLLSHPNPPRSRVPLLSLIVNQLTCAGVIIEDLVEAAHVDEKFMGIARLPRPGARARRLDLLWVPWEERGAALLYFTGSDLFNRSMRLLASRKGMSLNHHGLYKDVIRYKGEKLTEGTRIACSSEEEIFAALGIPYLRPQDRNA
ncbi:hypothetical protein H9P43_007192 [Blastocladiella emersonii ATCC 22665]|nr:hypothetical protein H9P43_007192 [Blastocladiella emersonii ATCC 22665]